MEKIDKLIILKLAFNVLHINKMLFYSICLHSLQFHKLACPIESCLSSFMEKIIEKIYSDLIKVDIYVPLQEFTHALSFFADSFIYSSTKSANLSKCRTKRNRYYLWKKEKICLNSSISSSWPELTVKIELSNENLI